MILEWDKVHRAAKYAFGKLGPYVIDFTLKSMQRNELT